MPDIPSSDTQHEQAAEVRRRAASGAMLIGLRTVAIRVIGLGGNIVLARFLTPASFGIVAVGYVILAAGSLITDGGLGGALLRARTPPERADLASVTGYQLVGGLIVVAIAAIAGLILGGDALVTTVMACSLPVTILQTPAAIVLERDLLYRPLVISDLAQTIVFNAWAILAVVAFGAGVWGIATGLVVSAAVSTLVVSRLCPMPFVFPSLNWSRVRPLLAFGARFQAIGLVGLGRDQGINSLTGAIGGLSDLGLWSLAYRLLQPASLVFDTLRRVSYPGMARLSELNQDVSDLVKRAQEMTLLAGCFALAPLAASARPLVPFVFGARWAPCSDVLTLSAWGILPSGALSVAAGGFLLSRGAADKVLRAVVAHSIAMLVVVAVFLPLIGIDALGLSSIAAGLSDAVVFGQALRLEIPGLNPYLPLARGVFINTAALATGWVAANAIGSGIPAILVGAITALLVALALALWLERDTLASLYRTARSTIGGASARA